MAAQASHSILEILTFWFFMGSGLLGLPPGERDPALLTAVPPQTLVYFEWASRGSGQPNVTGIDGFVADPEVQQFLEQLDAALAKRQPVEQTDSEIDLQAELPGFIKRLTAHPGCLFVGFEPPPPARPGLTVWLNMLMGVHGGMIFSTGNDTDAIWQTLVQMLKADPNFSFDETSPTQSVPIAIPGYKLSLHREGTRILFALGDKTLPRILDGLAGKQPGLDANPRFRQVLDRMAVPRVATIGWIDGQGISTSIIAALGPLGALVRPVLTITAADSLNHSIQVSGVENGTMVHRGFVATNGRTDGILVLAAGQPIQPQHFAHIPADADLVFAASVSLKNIYLETRRLLATAQPLSVRVFDEAVTQLEKELELSIADDVLTAFGDVVTAFDSPSAGGMVATSLVISLEVRDRTKAAAVFERVMKLVEQSLSPDSSDSEPGSANLRKQQFLDHTLYYIHPGELSYGTGRSITPTFCLTDRHLLFAIHPQAMKAQLRHHRLRKAGFDQLASQKVSLPAGDILAYAYINGPRANTLLGSVLPFIGQTALSQLSGVTIDSYSIPSTAAIAPYFGDFTTGVVRQKDGILIDSRNLPPALVSMAILIAYRDWQRIDFDFIEEVRRRRAPGADQAQLGPVQDGVVPARALQKPADQAKANPSVYRRLAPLFLKALIPDNLQSVIPDSAYRRIEQGPPPDVVQRREEARKRREERRQQRLKREP